MTPNGIETYTSGRRWKYDQLLTVLSFSLVLGMAVAIGIYLLWRANPAALDFHQPLFLAVLVVCPAFILSIAAGAGTESAIAQVLFVGTIVIANGCLYAGVAAGVYSLVTFLWKPRRPV
jgi:FtsH-binding integral membrane protein